MGMKEEAPEFQKLFLLSGQSEGVRVKKGK